MPKATEVCHCTAVSAFFGGFCGTNLSKCLDVNTTIVPHSICLDLDIHFASRHKLDLIMSHASDFVGVHLAGGYGKDLGAHVSSGGSNVMHMGTAAVVC